MLYDSSYTTHSAVAGGPVPWAGERPAVDGGDHVEFQAPHVRTNKECLTNTHMYIITQIHILSKHAWHVSSGPSHLYTITNIHTNALDAWAKAFVRRNYTNTHTCVDHCMHAGLAFVHNHTNTHTLIHMQGPMHLYTITQIQTHKYTCDHACIGQSICTVAITQI